MGFYKYIGTTDSDRPIWAKILLESEGGERRFVYFDDRWWEDRGYEPGDIVEAIVDKLDSTVWKIAKIKEGVKNPSPENYDLRQSNTKGGGKTITGIQVGLPQEQSVEAKPEETEGKPKFSRYGSFGW